MKTGTFVCSFFEQPLDRTLADNFDNSFRRWSCNRLDYEYKNHLPSYNVGQGSKAGDHGAIMPKILTQDQINFYHEKGYLKAPSIMPASTIELGRSVCAQWVDTTIQGWVEKGLIDNPRADLDLAHRLAVVWKEAGKPLYSRSPRPELVSQNLFNFMTNPHLLDIVEDLLGTPELFMHGVFSARPKLPDQRWTQTPWHQDSQYFPSIAKVHTVTVRIPLQPVTIENSCLQVAEGYHRGEMYASYDDEETGFLGISKEEREKLTGIPIEMGVGDVLCFTQLTPHAALPNKSDSARWSLDIRFQATQEAMKEQYNTELGGRKYGFITRSAADPNSVASWEDWRSQWEGDQP